MDERRVPVLIGAAQYTHHPDTAGECPEPLAMMEAVARAACEDSGSARVLPAIDSVQVVNIFCWTYADPPGMLAARLGIDPRHRLYTAIGGNTPQWLVNGAAEAIARGEVGVALLAGAEAMRTLRSYRSRGAMPPWTVTEGRPQMAGDLRPGVNDLEARHGMRLPVEVYPLFENALRARAGESIEEHQRKVGELMARFTRVAAKNPYAWFREERTAGELITVGPDNRMVGFPYPKRLNAIIEVDQAAAVVMTSLARARELGVPRDRIVFLWGGADATDIWHVSERLNYVESPAIRAAGRAALAQAGLHIDDIAYLDLYSCFPSAVQIGRDALGIAPDDPRDLTVTGGLPYHGGPGNNYSMHAIATMVSILRRDPAAKALVTALGWFITKHSAGVYGGTPPPRQWSRDPRCYDDAADAVRAPRLVAGAEGAAAIETYTVVHSRDGAPERGIIIGRLDDGRRFVANTPAGDRAALEALEREEGVGRRGRVRHDPATNTNVFELA
jgi:acetyl-CoA C-acetyltransferase